VLSPLQKLPYGFVAALTGVMAFPLPSQAAEQTATQDTAAVTSPAPDTESDPIASPSTTDATGTSQAAGTQSETEPDPQADSCLVKTICSVKQTIRWQTPAWNPSQCQRIANAVSSSAKRHGLSPTLLLAVMINESDMNEKATRVYLREGKIYAKDGGLMAIRCIVDKKDHCVNGNVRGMAWKDIMDPVTNIEVGARELAYWRDGGGVSRTVVHRRDSEGHMQEMTKNVPCHHLTHAWWAHYNHGPRYIDKGYPRHYPTGSPCLTTRWRR
jgi:hypothetical protein